MPPKKWIRTGLALFSAITACLFAISCAHRTTPASYSIHLQHGFDHSKVEVLINGRQHFKGVVTSDASLGLAKELPNTGPCTQVTVKVRCDDGSTSTQDYYPAPSRGVLIGVSFDPFTNQVNIEQHSKAILYD
jgi:hypothetical protein